MPDLLIVPAATAAVAEFLAPLLLNMTVKGSVVLLVAVALRLALHGASAAARHQLWALTFLALLSIPPLSLVLPGWELPLFPSASFTAVEVRPLPGVGSLSLQSSLSLTPSPITGPGTAGVTWVHGVVAAWLAGATLMFLILLRSAARVRRLAREGRAAAQPWNDPLERFRVRLGIRRPVRLIESHAIEIPMTWGTRRPVVLLPTQAADWPRDRRESVLLHELVHIRRRDYAIHIAAEAARALYWFHPLIWIATRQLRAEREHASDDEVLRNGTRPSDYAAQLLAVMHAVRARRNAVFAAVAIAERPQLSNRLIAILDPHRRRGVLSRRMTLFSMICAAAAIVPLTAMTPAQQTQKQGEPVPEVTRQPAAATLPRPPSSWTAFATEVETPTEIIATARALTGSDQERYRRAATRLRRLFDAPGLNIYIEYDGARGPLDLVVVPHDRSHAILNLDSVRFLSAGAENLPASANGLVAVFQLKSPDQDTHTLRVPIGASRITLVADGQPVLEFAAVAEHTPSVIRLSKPTR